MAVRVLTAWPGHGRRSSRSGSSGQPGDPPRHDARSWLLGRLGATYLPKRWVADGTFITSAGIDTALALVARLTDEPAARMVQRQLADRPEFADLAQPQADPLGALMNRSRWWTASAP